MSVLRNLGESLIRPHPRLQDEEQRRRARLLAGVTLVMLVLSVSLFAIAALGGGALSGLQYSLTSVGMMGLGYVLSRTRWPQVGSWAVVIGLTVVTLVGSGMLGDPNMAARTLTFVALPILLASLLLRAPVTLAYGVLVTLTITLMPFGLDWLPFRTILIPLIVTALVSTMAAMAAVLQERYIAVIRRQAAELSHYSHALETEVDRRTRNVMAVSEVGRAITGARNLDALLKQVVKLIVERFDVYHAQVFLVDEAGQNAVLRASTGLAGQQLLGRGHRLPVGSKSVIGQVTAQGEAVVALDTDTDPVHRRNELLPDTRSEIALPLHVGGKVVGALDIQSVEPNAFSPDDVPVFQTMADQLAIAIENAHLFGQAQDSMAAIERLNRQLTGEAWREYMAGRTHAMPLGYQADGTSLQPLEAEQTDERPASPEAISLPLVVRGEPIGAIDIQPKGDQEPLDADAQAMLEAVAERVAVALDNTRLAEQAQRTAWREQIINQISTKLQRSHDVQAILRTALTELGRALGMQRGFAQLMQREDGQRSAEDEGVQR